MTLGNDFFPPFSEKEMESRRGRIRAAMRAKGIDCLIIYGAYSMAGNSPGQINLVYLSNYAGVIQSYLVFPQAADPTLIIRVGLHVPNARDLCSIADIRAQESLEIPLGERLQELSLEKGRIGIVGPYAGGSKVTIPVEHHQYLKETFPQARLENVTDWYETLRLIKSEEEIALLKRAAALTDLAHQEIFLETRPGIRHSDLRRHIGGIAARMGATYPFAHISSTTMLNPKDVYPDFYPTHQTVDPGHVLMTELALGYGNYFGKLWGTYFVGDPTPEYCRLFTLAAGVHDQTISGLKPGMRGRDLNKFLQPLREEGCVNLIPLIMGWSTYNHAPLVGALEGTPGREKVGLFDDFVFEPGHCVTVICWPALPGTKKAVWVGSTCVFTREGLQRLHSYPINELKVVPP